MKVDKIGRIYLCKECLQWENIKVKYENLLTSINGECYRCKKYKKLFNKDEAASFIILD